MHFSWKPCAGKFWSKKFVSQHNGALGPSHNDWNIIKKISKQAEAAGYTSATPLEDNIHKQENKTENRITWTNASKGAWIMKSVMREQPKSFVVRDDWLRLI